MLLGDGCKGDLGTNPNIAVCSDTLIKLQWCFETEDLTPCPAVSSTGN